MRSCRVVKAQGAWLRSHCFCFSEIKKKRHPVIFPNVNFKCNFLLLFYWWDTGFRHQMSFLWLCLWVYWIPVTDSICDTARTFLWRLAKNTLYTAFCKEHHLSEWILFLLGVLKQTLFAFVYLSFLFSWLRTDRILKMWFVDWVAVIHLLLGIFVAFHLRNNNFHHSLIDKCAWPTTVHIPLYWDVLHDMFLVACKCLKVSSK